jgi:hypothetical protein
MLWIALALLLAGLAFVVIMLIGGESETKTKAVAGHGLSATAALGTTTWVAMALNYRNHLSMAR